MDAVMEVARRMVLVGQQAPDRITLDSGIVLGVRNVSREAIAASLSTLEEPQVPTYANPNTGMPTPNPNHPDYLAALQTYNEHVLEAAWRIMLYLGTEFISAPEGKYGPGDDGWVEIAQAAGLSPRMTEGARYVDWLQLYAVTAERERAQVAAAVLARSGVPEVRVAQAIAYFWRRQERGTDRTPAGEELGGDGDHGGEAPPVASS